MKKIPASPLRKVCLAGLILALIISWGLVILILFWNSDLPGGKNQEGVFARELEEYDFFDAPKRVLEGENPEQIERRLSRLQKQAQSVEEQLSVLKRRRALALLDRRYTGAYEKAAREAAGAFPWSSPLAAVAADALSLDPASQNSALLAEYASGLSQSRFGLLELGVHILAGNLEDPATAAALPGLENLLSQDISGISAQVKRDLLLDDFLLKAVKGDVSGAAARLNTLIPTADTGQKRMAAEFFYDHNNPLKAAELFLSLAPNEFSNTVRDIAWAADALFLAGEVPGARNIWTALSAEPGSYEYEVPADIINRSLYNLAASSTESLEEALWLEKYFSRRGRNRDSTDSTELYSIVRYTRLLDADRAFAVFGEEGMSQHPLLDLELLRRRLDTWPPTRVRAEIWMLQNRQSGEELIYEWAAWYFDYQRLFAETAQLLKEAERKGITGSWLDLHRSLALIIEGKTTEGEMILKEAFARSAGNSTVDWRIPANLGRIQESRRAISAAAEYYETATALLTGKYLIREKKAAAQVQMRLSRCLETLGRTRESRRAIEYALELDPDNLNIRRELRRLDGR